jgi:hypothetical protein
MLPNTVGYLMDQSQTCGVAKFHLKRFNLTLQAIAYRKITNTISSSNLPLKRPTVKHSTLWFRYITTD